MIRSISIQKPFSIVHMAMAIAGMLLVASGSARAASTVSKAQRDLLVVANLSTNGDPRFQWLYQFLDGSAVVLAQMNLGPHYRKIHVVSGSNAKKASFTQQIRGLAQNSAIKALDVMVHLHGSSGRLWFQDGSRTSANIRADLQATPLSNKLRTLYSTACYGATHAQDFVSAGFKSASGARKVNANSSFEYPVILGKWALGQTFGAAITAGNDPTMRNVHDSAARMAGFNDADSFKIIKGSTGTRITSAAN